MKKRSSLINIGIVLIAILAFFTAKKIKWEMFLPDAPEFTGHSENTREDITPASLTGKYVMLNFWASWCQICVLETDHLQQIHNAYKSKNFLLIGIATSDLKDGFTNSLKFKMAPWPLIFDQGNQIAHLYGVYALPQTFIIGPNGSVQMHLKGKIDIHKLGQIQNFLDQRL